MDSLRIQHVVAGASERRLYSQATKWKASLRLPFAV